LFCTKDEGVLVGKYPSVSDGVLVQLVFVEPLVVVDDELELLELDVGSTLSVLHATICAVTKPKPALFKNQFFS
jgi:hypothetical protein